MPASRNNKKKSVASLSGASKSGAKDEATAKRRKVEPAAASASRASATSSACKCQRCGRLSGATRWWETSKQLDKKQVMKEVAVGNRCFDCGDLHSRAFGHLSWEGFCEHGDDELVVENVKQAEESKNGHPKSFPTSAVMFGHGIALELRSSALVLNEAELKKKLGLSRLPKNLKSIPTVSLPKVAGDELKQAQGRIEYETFYCFKDPSMPFRTASVIQAIGAQMQEPKLNEQLWERQAESVMQQSATSTLTTTEGNKIIESHRHLLDLDDFVTQRSANKPNKKKKGGQMSDAGKAAAHAARGGTETAARGDAEASEAGDDAEGGESEESENQEGSESECEMSDNENFRTPLKGGEASTKAAMLTSSCQKSAGGPAPSPHGTASSVAGSGADDMDDTQLTGCSGVGLKLRSFVRC